MIDRMVRDKGGGLDRCISSRSGSRQFSRIFCAFLFMSQLTLSWGEDCSSYLCRDGECYSLCGQSGGYQHETTVDAEPTYHVSLDQGSDHVLDLAQGTSYTTSTASRSLPAYSRPQPKVPFGYRSQIRYLPVAVNLSGEDSEYPVASDEPVEAAEFGITARQPAPARSLLQDEPATNSVSQVKDASSQGFGFGGPDDFGEALVTGFEEYDYDYESIELEDDLQGLADGEADEEEVKPIVQPPQQQLGLLAGPDAFGDALVVGFEEYDYDYDTDDDPVNEEINSQNLPDSDERPLSAVGAPAQPQQQSSGFAGPEAFGEAIVVGFTDYEYDYDSLVIDEDAEIDEEEEDGPPRGKTLLDPTRPDTPKIVNNVDLRPTVIHSIAAKPGVPAQGGRSPVGYVQVNGKAVPLYPFTLADAVIPRYQKPQSTPAVSFERSPGPGTSPSTSVNPQKYRPPNRGVSTASQPHKYQLASGRVPTGSSGRPPKYQAPGIGIPGTASTSSSGVQRERPRPEGQPPKYQAPGTASTSLRGLQRERPSPEGQPPKYQAPGTASTSSSGLQRERPGSEGPQKPQPQPQKYQAWNPMRHGSQLAAQASGLYRPFAVRPNNNPQRPKPSSSTISGQLRTTGGATGPGQSGRSNPSGRSPQLGIGSAQPLNDSIGPAASSGPQSSKSNIDPQGENAGKRKPRKNRKRPPKGSKKKRRRPRLRRPKPKNPGSMKKNPLATTRDNDEYDYNDQANEIDQDEEDDIDADEDDNNEDYEEYDYYDSYEDYDYEPFDEDVFSDDSAASSPGPSNPIDAAIQDVIGKKIQILGIIAG